MDRDSSGCGFRGCGRFPLTWSCGSQGADSKKQALKRRMELDNGEELRVLCGHESGQGKSWIMTAADKSLENKLGKWKDIPLSQAPAFYTILASAIPA